MTATAPEQAAAQRPLLAGLYAVALALVVPPLIDFTVVSLPLRPGEITWRFGAGGLLFNNALVLPLLGSALAAHVAVRLWHTALARVLAIFMLLAGVVLLIALPLFLLDFLQLRPSVNPELAQRFDYTAIKAMITGLLVAVAYLVAALTTWRGSSVLVDRSRSSAARRAGLVVGASPGS